MEFENRSGLKKYLDIYKERIIISLKESNEYKINFYLMNLFDIFHLITHLLLFYILISQFTEIFDWNLTDFAIYWFLNLISWKVLWLHNLRNFNLTLLKGDLNKDILRPVNTYFLSSIENIFGQNLISLIYVIPIIVFLILKNGYSFTFLNIIYIIFSWFYFMIMFNVINSTAFFMKKNMFIKEIFFRTESTINRFTPKTFETFPIKSIFIHNY